MKVLQSSSKGKGGRGRFHGSHDHGCGNKMRNNQSSRRSSNRNKEDERFSARFTDPRFKLSQQMRQRSHSAHSGPETELHRAAASDPRFASRLTSAVATASVRNVKNSSHVQHNKHKNNSKMIKNENDKLVKNTTAPPESEEDDNDFDKSKVYDKAGRYEDEDGSDESDIGIEEYEYVAEDGEVGYEHNGVFVGRSTMPHSGQFNKGKAKRSKETSAGDADGALEHEEELEEDEEYDVEDEDEDEDVCAWAPESVE